MSDEDKAMEAVALYAGDATFATIAEKLEVSKSFAQVLVRRGIELSLNELGKRETGETYPKNPGYHPDGRDNPIPVEIPSFDRVQDIGRPESFMLETVGIGRKILLTPKAIMIYDLWRGAGFTGDLSDFLEDAVNFLYQSKRPAERFR